MKASPTLAISVEGRGTRLSLATTFGASAVARLATAVPNVTGPNYSCIAAVQPTPAMFVLRLFRTPAVKLLPQVPRSPPHQSPHPCTPQVLSAVPKLPPRSHSPPIPPPKHQRDLPATSVEALDPDGGQLLQDLMKGTFGTPVCEQHCPPWGTEADGLSGSRSWQL